MPELFRPGLTDHGLQDLRGIAVDVAAAGMAATDPAKALKEQVFLDGDELCLPDCTFDLSAYNRIWVVGAGKATGTLAQAMEGILGDRVTGGLVVVREGSAVPLRNLRLLEAEHPLPGRGSIAAGRAVLEVADKVGAEDLVISLVTGGSSSLVCVPAGHITSHEKRDLHRRLLSSGANIEEINTVRKFTSGVKGGKLAERFGCATIINLSVSDVAGDPEQYICDLTVRNDELSSQAIDVLRRYQLWEVVAASVREVLEKSETRLPSLEGIDIHTHMLVTGRSVCDAMVDEAVRQGIAGVVIGTEMCGPAAGIGAVLAGLAMESARRGALFPVPCVLVACGGESTVVLTDPSSFGKGGPNQELAVAAATRLGATDRVALLAIDTDGSDGGTDACGALIDSTTARRAREMGVDLHQALSIHETHDALNAIHDLIITGPTHTNVNDLIVVAIGRET